MAGNNPSRNARGERVPDRLKWLLSAGSAAGTSLFVLFLESGV